MMDVFKVLAQTAQSALNRPFCVLGAVGVFGSTAAASQIVSLDIFDLSFNCC